MYEKFSDLVSWLSSFFLCFTSYATTFPFNKIFLSTKAITAQTRHFFFSSDFFMLFLTLYNENDFINILKRLWVENAETRTNFALEATTMRTINARYVTCLKVIRIQYEDYYLR